MNPFPSEATMDTTLEDIMKDAPPLYIIHNVRTRPTECASCGARMMLFTGPQLFTDAAGKEAVCNRCGKERQDVLAGMVHRYLEKQTDEDALLSAPNSDDDTPFCGMRTDPRTLHPADMPIPERRTLDCVDVPLPGGRALRLALERDGDGAPEVLHLALGWGAGREWQEDRAHARGEAITLPAECLPELAAALDALRLTG